jgi:2-hydroxychromene-2-carboxylate isomerase
MELLKLVVELMWEDGLNCNDPLDAIIEAHEFGIITDAERAMLEKLV